jgi:hypothetical protein
MKNFRFINPFQLNSDLNIQFIGIENMNYQVQIINLNGRRTLCATFAYRDSTGDLKSPVEYAAFNKKMKVEIY